MAITRLEGLKDRCALTALEPLRMSIEAVLVQGFLAEGRDIVAILAD
jgi:hypothetical protein